MTDDRRDRARFLVSRMTPDERLAHLHQHTPAIPRLGLRAFRTGTEAAHGVAWLGTATVFPQPVGLAATWDPDLLRRVGEAVSTEVRARHATDPTVSLNVWAPVVNPLRHPRWGRTEEGFSEDPHVTAWLATAYAHGLRGDHPVVWRTVPTLKHVLAYGAEDDRATDDVRLSPRALHEEELPAFLAPLRAAVIGALMPSYNLVNGRPAHLHDEVLDLLRAASTAGSLLVVSDAGAPTNVVRVQRCAADHPTAFAALLRAGVDSFTDDGDDPAPTVARLRAALDRGLITQGDVDRAVRRLIELRQRTGEFEPDLDPYRDIGPDRIDTAEHRTLAREAVARSVVLLRNDGTLPLQPGARIAVVGPHADRVLHDWYSGTPPYTVGLATALAERCGADAVTVADGADRVLLRSHTTGRYLRRHPDGTVLADGASPAGGARCDEGGASAGSAFDLTDWGDGVVTLRDVATGLLWSCAGLLLRADATRVGGWVCQESFRLHRHDDGSWSVRHLGSGRWLRVQAGGTLGTDGGDDPADAERFTLRLLRSGQSAVAEAAAGADVVLVTAGNDPHLLGRETRDRPHLRLPEPQAELWRAAHAANPRTVLTVVSSYPYVLGDLGEHAPAIVWTSHGGQEIGHGLADVLCGDVEPNGRLAQTWPAREEHAGLRGADPIGAWAGHRYSPHEPAFAFGHGLAYTTVAYRSLTLAERPLDITDDPRLETMVTVNVRVANTGDRPTEELVQLYATAVDHRMPTPVRRLVDHARVPLAPGAEVDVPLAVRAADLAVWDVDRDRMVTDPGDYLLRAGPSAADLPLRAVLTVVEGGEAGAPTAAPGAEEEGPAD